MKRIIFLITAVLLAAGTFGYSQDLSVGPEDIKIEQSLEGGYNLWIRKKPGIARITSYNVCYTKLLRFAAIPDSWPS